MEVQPLNGCAHFEADPGILLVVDKIARRYGVLPSEVLELDVWELGLAMSCMMQADATSGTLIKRLNKDGMPVFPVTVLMQ